MFEKLLLLPLLFVFTLGAIPSFLKVCPRSNPDISGCIKESILSLREKLAVGEPEVGLPKIEPLNIPKIIMRNNPRSNITDVKMFGITKFEILEMKADTNKNQFSLLIQVPQITFEGNYNLDLKLSIIPIKGVGKITGELNEYKTTLLLKGKKVKTKGVHYLRFEPSVVKVFQGKSKLKFHDLFRHDKLLRDTTRDLLDENPEVFMDEVIPSFEVALGEILTVVANSITTKFSYDELFP